MIIGTRRVGICAKLAPAAIALLLLGACSEQLPEWARWPEHWDPWPGPRRFLSPREESLAQCRALASRFRVSCLHCHSTADEKAISRTDLRLTKIGRRAEVMRNSSTFGLSQDCSRCHMSAFKLNRYGESLFSIEPETRTEKPREAP